MTICFTLPYSSGGGEERRIKFDLLTAIIKCSLLAPIKGRGLMLTWLTLIRARQASLHFLLFLAHPATHLHPHFASLCHPLRHLACEHTLGWCVRRSRSLLTICVALNEQKKKEKRKSPFGQKPNHQVGWAGFMGKLWNLLFSCSCFISRFMYLQSYYYNEVIFIKS